MKFSKVFMLFLLILTTLMVRAESIQMSLFISVSSSKATDIWARTTCEEIYKTVQNPKNSIRIACDWNRNSDFNPVINLKAKRLGQFDYLLEFRETETERFIRLVNWNSLDGADLNEFDIKFEKLADWQSSVKKLFGNLEIYHLYKSEIRKQIVQFGSQRPGELNTNIKKTTEVDVTRFINNSSENRFFISSILKLFVFAGVAAWKYNDITKSIDDTQRLVMSNQSRDFEIATRYKISKSLHLRFAYIQAQHRDHMTGQVDGGDTRKIIGTKLVYAF